MVELRPVDRTAVSVLASAEACEAVAGAATDYTVCRVAPDEILLVGEPGDGTSTSAAAEPAAGPDALVLDVTDGWTAWELRGPDAREAFARLSELELPHEGSAQGEVARLPVKILVGAGAITLLVPAMWGEYLRERILTDCRAVGVTEVVSS